MNANNSWNVYIHTNKFNGKKYVGITKHPPKKRWKNGLGYKNNNHFWRAIQKYGWDNFKHEIILQNETFEYACAVEKCLIKHYKTKNQKYGYNLTDGGEGLCGWTPTEETRKKMRENHADFNGSRNPNYNNHKLAGKNNPNYGKRHSKDAIEKIKAANAGVANKNRKAVYCIELNAPFFSSREAEKVTGVDHSGIIKCCKHKAYFCGKDMSTKSPLHWIYIEEAIDSGYITQHQYEDYLKSFCNESV